MKPTDNLCKDTEAVVESLAAMIKKELTIYSCHEGYLNPSEADPTITMITPHDRRALVDWCYEVVDHFQFSRETVASAMEMVDRFLSMPSDSASAITVARVSHEVLRDQTKFQLLTVAALYTSIKVNEENAISSDLFAEIGRLFYTAEEIEDMERTLLSGLSWQCHAPTAYQIGLSILSLILPYVDIPEVTWGVIMDEMKYLTELAVRDYDSTTQRTSTIALAATFNAISDTSTKECQEVLGAFLRIIMECFDFDHSNEIAAARARLSHLIQQETVVQEDDADEKREDDADEISFDDSVKTFRVSNTVDSNYWYKIEYFGSEGDESISGRDDRYLFCEEQELYPSTYIHSC
jgi:hypothetical protein